MDKEYEFLNIFPDKMKEFWKQVAKEAECVEEVRIRVNNPIAVLVNGKEYFVNPKGLLTGKIKEARLITQDEINGILSHICKSSVYAYRDELREGYITLPGGHRVGLAGETVVDENGQIITIKYVTFMNIRISHEILGAADKVMDFLFEEKEMQNTLIVSPPGCGKTTLLRDVVRQLSKGNFKRRSYKVGVIDERNEIAGCFQGMPQNDLGPRTDVLSGLSKRQAMIMMIRSMSPEVMALDELGGLEDAKALEEASKCGVKIVATIHAANKEELLQKPYLERIIREKGFKKIIILGKEEGKCVIKEMFDYGDVYGKTDREYSADFGFMRSGL